MNSRKQDALTGMKSGKQKIVLRLEPPPSEGRQATTTTRH